MLLANGVRRTSRWIGFEIFSRICLFAIFMFAEDMTPFERVIQPEEYWLYKFPTRESYVPSPLLWVLIVVSIPSVILIVYGFNKNWERAVCALAVPTLAQPLTGIITNIVKIAVGRPRPDYFSRCYGNDYNKWPSLTLQSLPPCTGDVLFILDGRKSFPSGHSSISFCCFGFLSLYIAGQLRIFNQSANGGRSLRLILSILPLFVALMVAISRTCDYHHHWQDVTVGSILGFCVVYLVYRQYFPSLGDPNCHKELSSLDVDQAGDINGGLLGRNYNRKIMESPTVVKTV